MINIYNNIILIYSNNIMSRKMVIPLYTMNTATGSITKMDININEYIQEINDSMDDKYRKYYENEPIYPKTFLDVKDDEKLFFRANIFNYDYLCCLSLDFKKRTFCFSTGGCQRCDDDLEGSFEFDDKTLTLIFQYEIDPYDESVNEDIVSCHSETKKGVSRIDDIKQRMNYKLIHEVKEHYCGYEKERTHLTLKIDKHIFSDEEMEVDYNPVFDTLYEDPFSSDYDLKRFSEKIFYTYSVNISDYSLDEYKEKVVAVWTQQTREIIDGQYLEYRAFTQLMLNITAKIPSFPLREINLDFMKKIYNDENLMLCLNYWKDVILYKENARRNTYPVPVYAKDGEIVLIAGDVMNYNYDSKTGKEYNERCRVLWIRPNRQVLTINSTKPRLVCSSFSLNDNVENIDFSKLDRFFKDRWNDNLIEGWSDSKYERDYYPERVKPYLESIIEIFKEEESEKQ